MPLSPRTDIIENQNLLELPKGRVYKISNDTKSYFVKFLERAVSSGATVYVCVPPVLEKINKEYLNTITSLTKNTGAKLIDFSNDESLLDRRELFNDRIHLNHEGAKILTDKFIKIIKNDSIY